MTNHQLSSWPPAPLGIRISSLEALSLEQWGTFVGGRGGMSLLHLSVHAALVSGLAPQILGAIPSLPKSKVQTVDLFTNRIDHPGAQALAAALPKSQVQELDATDEQRAEIAHGAQAGSLIVLVHPPSVGENLHL